MSRLKMKIVDADFSALKDLRGRLYGEALRLVIAVEPKLSEDGQLAQTKRQARQEMVKKLSQELQIPEGILADRLCDMADGEQRELLRAQLF